MNGPPLLLFPLDATNKISGPLLYAGNFLSKLFFSLKYDLQKAELQIDAERFCVAAILSAAIYAVIFFFVGIVFGIMIFRELGLQSIIIAFGFSFFSFFGFLIFHIISPKLAAQQIASMVDQELLFALRSILIQISSGISLFDSMRSISRSNFGQVSKEFGYVVKDINTGMSETQALEKLAFKTKSEILKKTVWQMIVTIRSGGSVVTALKTQVESLVLQQSDQIKSYSAELNLWTLAYLIIAAALPSLGITFLVIASAIGGSGVTAEFVTQIVILAMFIQIGLIMFIRSRVPKVMK
jgi:flagellar protein FlaJ